MDNQPIKSVDTVTCPNCGDAIPVSEALGHEMKEKVRGELKKKIEEQNNKIALEREELRKKEGELTLAKGELDKQVQKQVDAQREKIEQEAKVLAQKAVAVEIKDTQEQLKENKKKLEEAQQLELTMRRRERELEEEKKTLGLKVERQLSEERKKIEEATSKRLADEFLLKEAEKDKKLNDLKGQLEEMRRKAEQGSQQSQGEVLELELEGYLKSTYPYDVIEEVPKGFRGADVLQRVHTNNGVLSGTIIWESKRVKTWSEQWIGKLKEDQRQAKAEVAVIVSQALPKDAKSVSQKNGVWVCDFASVPFLVEALRVQIINVAAAKKVAEGRGDKMEHLYNYIASTEFTHRVQAIVEAFVSMQENLNKEKRATERQWALREKQIQQVIGNTAGMYGDLQGLIGASMQTIPALETGEPEDIEIEDETPQLVEVQTKPQTLDV